MRVFYPKRQINGHHVELNINFIDRGCGKEIWEEEEEEEEERIVNDAYLCRFDVDVQMKVDGKSVVNERGEHASIFIRWAVGFGWSIFEPSIRCGDDEAICAALGVGECGTDMI